jgi:hypothetical protein
MGNIIYSSNMRREDELMHWKYLKKVKLPNGKYRYIYDENELKKYEESMNASERATVNAAIDVVNLQKEYDTATKNYNDASLKNQLAVTTKKQAETFDAAYTALQNKKKSEAKLERAKKNHEQLVDEANKKIDGHKKEKLKAASAKTIAKGLNFIMDLFSRD